MPSRVHSSFARVESITDATCDSGDSAFCRSSLSRSHCARETLRISLTTSSPGSNASCTSASFLTRRIWLLLRSTRMTSRRRKPRSQRRQKASRLRGAGHSGASCMAARNREFRQFHHCSMSVFSRTPVGKYLGCEPGSSAHSRWKSKSDDGRAPSSITVQTNAACLRGRVIIGTASADGDLVTHYRAPHFTGRPAFSQSGRYSRSRRSGRRGVAQVHGAVHARSRLWQPDPLGPLCDIETRGSQPRRTVTSRWTTCESRPTSSPNGRRRRPNNTSRRLQIASVLVPDLVPSQPQSGERARGRAAKSGQPLGGPERTELELRARRESNPRPSDSKNGNTNRADGRHCWILLKHPPVGGRIWSTRVHRN